MKIEEALYKYWLSEITEREISKRCSKEEMAEMLITLFDHGFILPYFKHSFEERFNLELNSWIEKVDKEVNVLMELEDYSHKFDWDYEYHFRKGLSEQDAASLLQNHLVKTCWVQ